MIIEYDDNEAIESIIERVQQQISKRKEAFFGDYLREIRQQSFFEIRDLKVFAYVARSAMEFSLLPKLLEFVASRQSILHFVFVCNAVFYYQSDYRMMGELFQVLQKCNFNELYNLDEQYDQFIYKVEVLFTFFVNNIPLIPLQIDLIKVIVSWLSRLKYESVDDKEIADKMLETLFQISDRIPKQLQTHMPLIFEAVPKQIKIFKQLIEEIPDQLKENALYPSIQEYNPKNWQDFFKGYIMMGTTPKVTECAIWTVKCLVQKKKYNILLAIQKKLIPPIIKAYLKVPKFRQGAIQLIECFTIGPPNDSAFAADVLKNLDVSDDLALLVYSIAQKYSINEQDPLHEIIKKYKAPPQLQVNNNIKKYDWQGSFCSLQNQFKTVQQPFKGLINLGNTCYMNSLLQAFFFTRGFRTELLATDLSKSLMMLQLQKLFVLMKDSSRTVITPQGFRQTLSDFFKMGYFQHDSSELLKHVLDELDKVSKPILQEYFEGQTISQISCQDCQKETITTEAFVDLNLIVQEKNIQELISDSMAEEQLNEYKCSACSSTNNTKQSIFKSVAKNLVLTLNRFFFDRQTLKKAKLMTPVQIQEEISIRVDDQQHIFKLYAIIIHRGHSVDYGHYFTYAKYEDSWYMLNDSQANLIGKSIGSIPETPYMLFYQRDQIIKEQQILPSLKQYLEQDNIQFLKEEQKQPVWAQPNFWKQFQTNNFNNFRDDDEDGGGMQGSSMGGRAIF